MTSFSNGPIGAPFRGRFELKIDPKGRLSLPSSYRQLLGSDSKKSPSKSPSNNELIVTNSRYLGKSCLHAYTLNEWQKLERKIARLSSLKTEVQAFNRFYLSGGQVVEVDSQGRILIPQGLRRYAGLESQAVLVGMGAKFEIWAQDVWDKIYDTLTESFEATMDAVARLEEARLEEVNLEIPSDDSDEVE